MKNLKLYKQSHYIKIIFFTLFFSVSFLISNSAYAFCGAAFDSLTATNITDHSATLSVNFIGTFGACSAVNLEGLFDYGVSTGVYTVRCYSGQGGIGEYSCDITGLNPNTVYFFQPVIYAYDYSNTYGGSHYTYFPGFEGSFSTLDVITINPPSTPSSTPPASNISDTTATGNGEVTDTGGEDPEREIEWGTLSGVYTHSCTAGTGGIGVYSCPLTPLTPNTTYYIRTKVSNTGGTAHGNETSFTTQLTPITDNNTINLTINENLTLSCNGDITIDEGTPGLTAGNPESAHSTCTVTTNDEDGYDFSVINDFTSGNVMRNGSYSIPDYASPVNTPTPYIGEGLAFSIYDAPQKESKWGTGNSCHDTDNNYAAFPDSNTTITSNTQYAHDATDIGICYRINVLSTQASGIYTGSVTYTATGVL